MSLIVRYILVFVLIMLSNTAKSEVGSWIVRPSVCIVEELGATCEMNVQIEIDSLKGGTYCYYLDHKLLQCWSHDNPLKSLTLNQTFGLLVLTYMIF